MRRSGLILLAALLLAGCGDEDKVRAAVEAEQRALERRDWNAVCALRTDAGEREFRRGTLWPEAKTCAEAFTPPPNGNEPIVTFDFKSPTLREIDVDGDEATARFDDGSTHRLLKVDDRWLIGR